MRPGEWRKQLLSVDSWDYQLMVSQKTLFYSTEICEQALKCKTLGALYCILLYYYANARGQKLITPRFVAGRVVLSVLAPTRASGISRHRFGQG